MIRGAAVRPPPVGWLEGLLLRLRASITGLLGVHALWTAPSWRRHVVRVAKGIAIAVAGHGHIGWRSIGTLAWDVGNGTEPGQHH